MNPFYVDICAFIDCGCGWARGGWRFHVLDQLAFAAALDAFDATPVEWPDIPAVVAALPAVSADVKLLAVVAGVDFPDDELLQWGVGAVAGGAWTAAHPQLLL